MAAFARPEAVLRLADDVARVREQRTAAFEQAADVVGVPVREDHEVERLGREAGRRQLVGQPAAVGARHEALRPIARVEQHKLPAGVDDHRREARLVLVRRQEVVAHQRVDLRPRGVGPDHRPGPVNGGAGVQDGRDFEGAEPEAVMARLRLPEHGRRGDRLVATEAQGAAADRGRRRQRVPARPSRSHQRHRPLSPLGCRRRPAPGVTPRCGWGRVSPRAGRSA